MDRAKLAGRVEDVRERVARAAERAGREPSDVRLIAITKGHPFAAVEAALAFGLKDLGENRLGEWEAKKTRTIDRTVRWHMIGHVQRRKAPRLWDGLHLLHSLDSVRLAERLDRTAPEDARPLKVLVQVNTSGEEAKGGFEPEEIEERLGALLEMDTLRIDGLMTMAPFTDDERVLRRTFAGLRELQDELGARFPEYRGSELSMGMSNDFEVAVEEGSTMVRLGTVLFGERPE